MHLTLNRWLTLLITLSAVGALYVPTVALAQSPLRYGDRVMDALSGPDDDDIYAFVAQAGDVITATMDSLDPSLDPLLILTDGERRRVLAVDDDSGGSGNARLRAIIIDRGTYILRAAVSPKAKGGQGRYELRLNLNNPPLTPGPLTESPRLMPLPPGGGARADLSARVPSRWYALYARAGELIAAEVQPEGTLSAQLGLYTVGEGFLQRVGELAEGQLRANAPAEGWYFVAVLRGGGSGAFTLRRAAPPGDAPPTPTPQGPPAPAGQGLISGLPVRGDGPEAALYHFTGLAGSLITLAAGSDWAVILADSSLRQIGVGVTAVRAQLPADGLYYALLLPPPDGVGSAFMLTLQGAFSPTATPTREANTAAPIPLVYGAQIGGEVRQAAPLAYYSFQGKAGDLVAIRAEAVDSSLIDPLLYVYSYQAGRPTLIGANDNANPGGSAAALDLQLPADGPYLIVVTDAGFPNGAEGGEFSLTLKTGVSK